MKKYLFMAPSAGVFFAVVPRVLWRVVSQRFGKRLP